MVYMEILFYNLLGIYMNNLVYQLYYIFYHLQTIIIINTISIHNLSIYFYNQLN